MRPYKHILEVGLFGSRVVSFLWSEVIKGAPGIDSLKRFVDDWNLDRAREDLGRAPWQWARIVDRDTGDQIVYYKPEIDGIGRRVEK